VIVYAPAELVTVVFFMFVASLVTVTLAFATTAPELSVTVPVMLARAYAFSLPVAEKNMAKTPIRRSALCAKRCKRVQLASSWRTFVNFMMTPLSSNLGKLFTIDPDHS
jgi:hypothetical protein